MPWNSVLLLYSTFYTDQNLPKRLKKYYLIQQKPRYLVNCSK